MKYSNEGEEIHRDTHKGENGGNIQAMGTSRYFIVRQVAQIGVSDHCEKKPMTCPHEYIYLKFLWTGFHILQCICKSYGIKIPPLGRSHCYFPPCLYNQRRRGWVHVQGGGGVNSMIKLSVENFPLDPLSCLFECLFSTFLVAYILSFDVIIINN